MAENETGPGVWAAVGSAVVTIGVILATLAGAVIPGLIVVFFGAVLVAVAVWDLVRDALSRRRHRPQTPVWTASTEKDGHTTRRRWGDHMDGKISHTTDVLIAPPEAAQPEDSSEQPAGIEVKYPSGRQDAVVMPATVAVGPPHLGGVAPSVVDQCRALSEAMLVMLGPDPRRPPFIRSVANMAALQRLAVYATLGDQLEAIEEATADQRLRDLKRRFESESDPLDRFDLARKIALRLAALGGQGH